MGRLVLQHTVGDGAVIEFGSAQVVVTVERVRGGKVRVSYAAPEDVGIWRSAVFERSVVFERKRAALAGANKAGEGRE